MTQNDVTLVNSKTNETPQVLASGQVDAIGAWQPNSGLAMKALPGARPVYTSAQAPGLIYDVLTVNPASMAAHRADYLKLIRVCGTGWSVTSTTPKPRTMPCRSCRRASA